MCVSVQCASVLPHMFGVPGCFTCISAASHSQHAWMTAAKLSLESLPPLPFSPPVSGLPSKSSMMQHSLIAPAHRRTRLPCRRSMIQLVRPPSLPFLAYSTLRPYQQARLGSLGHMNSCR